MKNLKFDQLERSTPEDDWLSGELLYGAGAIKAMREVEKRFWVATVEDGAGSFEVEMHVTPTRLKVGACECPQFRQRQSCGHLVAALLWLRARLTPAEPRAPKPKVAKTTGNRPQRLAQMLADADPAVVHAFLLGYSRRYPAFAAALRAHLAPPTHNHAEQTRDVLEQTLRTARLADGRIGLRGAQQIARTVDDLLLFDQRQQAEGFWGEVADLVTQLLERLPPVLRKIERGRETILSSLNQAIQLLHDVLGQKRIAPALREKNLQWLRNYSLKLTMRNWQLDLPLWGLRLRYDTDAGLLATDLRELIHTYLTEGRPLDPLLDSSFKIWPTDFTAWLTHETIQQPGWRWPVMSWLAHQEQWTAAGELAALFGENGLPAPDEVLEPQLLEVLLHSGHTQLLRTYLLRNLLSSLQFRYYTLLTQLYALADAAAVVQEVEKLPYSGRKIELVAAMLADTARWDDLLAWLQRYPLAELLRLYCQPLYTHHPTAFTQLAESWLQDHLRKYLGRKTAIQIRDLLLAWHKAGATRMVSKLILMLRKNFPERHTLQEELAIFQP